MRLRQASIIFGVFLLITSGIYYIVTKQQERTQSDIISTKDTRLDNYRDAKLLALKVKDITAIDTDEDYQAMKQDAKDYLSDDLYEYYFQFKNYTEGPKPYKLKLNSITGQEVRQGTQYLFKLDMTMVSDQDQTPLVLLVTVQNGFIQNIESLG